MKKRIILLLSLLCLLITSCSNEFARQEYDSDEKIAQTANRYSKVKSVFNSRNGECSLTVSKFDGRETLWEKTIKEGHNIEIDISFCLSEGKAKFVHIDSDDNVTTIIECEPETSTDGFITETVSLKSGKNRLRIVGYGCKDMELKMVSEELQD